MDSRGTRQERRIALTRKTWRRWQWPDWCLNTVVPCIEAYIVDDETGKGRWIPAEPHGRILDDHGFDAELNVEYEWGDDVYAEDVGPRRVRRRGQQETVRQILAADFIFDDDDEDDGLSDEEDDGLLQRLGAVRCKLANAVSDLPAGEDSHSSEPSTRCSSQEPSPVPSPTGLPTNRLESLYFSSTAAQVNVNTGIDSTELRSFKKEWNRRYSPHNSTSEVAKTIIDPPVDQRSYLSRESRWNPFAAGEKQLPPPFGEPRRPVLLGSISSLTSTMVQFAIKQMPELNSQVQTGDSILSAKAKAQSYDSLFIEGNFLAHPTACDVPICQAV